MNRGRKAGILLWLFSTILTFAALYLVFMVVPNERSMGPVQRIFYFHVGSAVASYFSVAVLFAASLFYLSKRSPSSDILAQAAGETGMLFCTMVLFSGMIWAHSAWNTWFSWEPRLVTFLLLWMIFLAINLLRAFGEPARVAQHCAVLAILGAITVPVIIVSVKILPQIAQLHPQVIANRGLRDPSFKIALSVAAFAMIFVQFLLLSIRYRIGVAEQTLELRRQKNG